MAPTSALIPPGARVTAPPAGDVAGALEVLVPDARPDLRLGIEAPRPAGRHLTTDSLVIAGGAMRRTRQTSPAEEI